MPVVFFWPPPDAVALRRARMVRMRSNGKYTLHQVKTIMTNEPRGRIDPAREESASVANADGSQRDRRKVRLEFKSASTGEWGAQVNADSQDRDANSKPDAEANGNRIVIRAHWRRRRRRRVDNDALGESDDDWRVDHGDTTGHRGEERGRGSGRGEVGRELSVELRRAVGGRYYNLGGDDDRARADGDRDGRGVDVRTLSKDGGNVVDLSFRVVADASSSNQGGVYTVLRRGGGPRGARRAVWAGRGWRTIARRDRRRGRWRRRRRRRRRRRWKRGRERGGRRECRGRNERGATNAAAVVVVDDHHLAEE